MVNKRYKLIYSSKALSDIETAFEYYEEQQAGLGKKFVARIQSAIKSVKLNPEFVTIRYDDIRCAIVPKFPFLIHYRFDKDEKTVFILAVFSTRREPLW